MGMFSIGQILQGIYVHASPYGTSRGNLRVYIPAIQELINSGKYKDTPNSLQSSAFANAGDCKPSVQTKIATQNYLTAQSHGSYSEPYYSYGDAIAVSVQSTDGLVCRLEPSEIDNSWDFDDD